MKDFIKEIDKSYPIPSQIAIMSGNEPIDMRQTCYSVEDFEKFKSDTGMELRYAGLITFEKSTGIFKGCIENEKGVFSWVDLNIEKQNEIITEVVQMTKTLEDLQEKVSSVMLEFEESVKMMRLDFN